MYYREFEKFSTIIDKKTISLPREIPRELDYIFHFLDIGYTPECLLYGCTP